MSCATTASLCDDDNNMSSAAAGGAVIKLEPRPEGVSVSAGVVKANASQQQTPSNNNNNNNNAKSNNPGPQKALPSFNDLLWCPDVDGDVMSQGIGGAMVGRSERRKCIFCS